MKSFRFVLTTVCLFVLVIGTSYVKAESEGKHSRILLTNLIAGRVLPREGAADTFELHYRYYYTDTDSIISKNNYFGFGLSDTLSPATNSVGAFIEVEPIAVFNLRIQYDYLQYFGQFTAMLLFPQSDSDFSDDRLDDLQGDNEAVWATGTRFSIEPTFQVMYKRFVALNTARFQWYDINKDDYFYNPSEDTLMYNEEYIFVNDAVAGIAVWKKSDDEMIILGPRHVYTWVDETNRERQELSGVLVWMMSKKRWIMEKPMLMCAAGGYLVDRYREKDVFIGAMFKFEYTLWKKGSKL